MTSSSAGEIDFTQDVMPVLKKHCLGCHTESESEGGVVLSSYDALMGGGDHGKMVVAGDPEASRLLGLVDGSIEPAMPPEGEEPLSIDQVRILAQWIRQGASGPPATPNVPQRFEVPEVPTAADIRIPVTAIASGFGRQALARFGRVEIRRDDQTLIRRIRDLPGKVNSLEFSRDGRRILVGSGVTGGYGRAAIYSVESGKLIHEFLGHRDTLYVAKFSPDETLVATAGYDRRIILWDVRTGQPRHQLEGHHGAVFDLCFSPDGKVLVSACADETAKVWSVSSGIRLDTLGQCEGEALATRVTRNGGRIIVAGADSRVRVWRLLSTDRARTNPLLLTRFVDEAPLTHMALTRSGDRLVVISESGNVQVLDLETLRPVHVLESVGETASDLVIAEDDKSILVSLMDGRVVRRDLPSVASGAADSREVSEACRKWLDPEPLQQRTEADLRGVEESTGTSAPLLPRFAAVTGALGARGQVDRYRWEVAAGEVWAIDVDADHVDALDPTVQVLDADGEPVLRVRLQAIRDSYFTFRGKNSSQTNDFRMFGWQELGLNDYLYAAGEVTRLWMHPRGPDSGFNVYPGEGKRWTYFGTSHVTHALGEPAYVVRPLKSGDSPLANGLPVFDVYFGNDDDPSRTAGKNSRLIFTAPESGVYTLAIADTRGGGGGQRCGYRLSVRAAVPDFNPMVTGVKKPIPRGAGREFTVRVDRADEFAGPVTFDFDDLPEGLFANTPLTVESGQSYATGVIWAGRDAELGTRAIEPTLTATAIVNGLEVTHPVGSIGQLSVMQPPRVTVAIRPTGDTVESAASGPPNPPWVLELARGSTAAARVVLERAAGFDAEVSLGKEKAGRNATHGVYVDHIGLNGLLVRKNERQREFFITADPVARPGRRSFFLTANVDGGVCSYPIIVEVLP